MKKANLTHSSIAYHFGAIFRALFLSLFFAGGLYAQSPCEANAEFFYDKAVYCPNGGDPILSHAAGTDGYYTYEVISGGPALSLNPVTGAISVFLSDRGVYEITNSLVGSGLAITGVVDGPLPDGLPKAVEFFALADIPDLSAYGFGSASNGNGQEFTFPPDAVTKGAHIWVAAEAAAFQSFFGFTPTYVHATASAVNGQEAIELFYHGKVSDVFGTKNQSGAGQPWEYTGGWAYRKDNTGPDGFSFVLDNWIFSGVGVLDNASSNDTASIPWPIGAFSSNKEPLCSNAVYSQTIVLDDLEAPTFTCPSNIAITLGPGECETIVYYSLEASDNCGGDSEVVQVDGLGLSSGDYFHYGSYALEYECTDQYGNVATCSFQITVNEYPKPSSVLACNDNVQISLNKDGQVVVGAAMVLEGGPYGCYNDYIVTVYDTYEAPLGNVMDCSHVGEVWTVSVTDPNTGNRCWGEIRVKDKMPPVVHCEDRVISCSQDIGSLPKPTAIDNCDPAPVVANAGVFLMDDEPCDDNEVKYIRTWIAEDKYGNTSLACEEVVTVQRPANVDFPNDITFYCTPVGNTGVPKGLDGKHCAYSYTYQDEFIEICEGATEVYKIIRTWVVLDWCSGQIITAGFDDVNNNGIQDPGEEDEDNIQIIMKVDNVPPVIEVGNVTVSANLAGEHPEPCRSTSLIPAPIVTDDCSGVAEVHIFTPIGEAINGVIPAPGLPIGIHSITYTATDKCGNYTSVSGILSVVDDIAPVAICDKHTDVNLTSEGLAEVFASTFDDGSHDNCCLDRFEVRRMSDSCDDSHDDLTFGFSVHFCCADIANSPVAVVFRVYDCYDNHNDCMVEVQVNDKLSPILASCPSSERITCDFYAEHLQTQLAALATQDEKSLFLDQFFGLPEFIDNCEPNIKRNFSSSLDQCLEGTITRSWQAQDDAGNTSISCTQVISVDHISDWSVEFPADIILSCGSEAPEFGEPVIFNETCELIAISYQDEVFNVVEDACYKILRTWTVINWCVVGSEIDQEVVELSEAQLFNQGVTTLADRDINGDGYFNSSEENSNKSHRTFRDSWNNTPGKKHKPVAADAQSFSPIADPDTDPDSDPWDGYIAYQQTIKVIDNVAPVFSNGCDIPDVCIEGASCSADVLLPLPEVSDCSSDLVITAQIKLGGDWVAGAEPYLDIEPGTYELKYNASDKCNNQTDCFTTVTVKDCKKPTPYCKNGLIVTLMNVQPPVIEVWASDLNENSFDNCPGELQFSFSQDANDKSIVFGCEKANTATLINVWVTDAAGNQDYCQTLIIVEDNMDVCADEPYIAFGGMITNESNQGIQGVEVSLSGSSSAAAMTGQDGNYQFSSIVPGGDYSIVPGKDIQPLNGVSTLDLVLISKHILGIQALDSPYKIIAADVNHSNSVTTFDLVELRKLILFINEDFPSNTSWRFVKKDFVFPNPANPWQTSFPELINLNNVPDSDLNISFVGIKIGDVNGSAVVHHLADAEERDAVNALIFNVKDSQVEAGGLISIPFMVENTAVAGFQFSLNFDPKALEFVQVLPAIAGEENFGFTRASQGILTASWSRSDGTAQALDGKAFELSFRVKRAGQLSDLLHINSRLTKAEAYDERLALMDVALNFGKNNTQAVFELFQNTPNPFSAETIIGFQMGEAGRACLTLTELSGRVVKTISGDFAKGYHEIRLQRSDLGSSSAGVLYYRLETGSFVAARKLILTD